MSESYPIRDVFRHSLDDYVREYPVSSQQCLVDDLYGTDWCAYIKETFKDRFSADTPKDILLMSLGIDVRTCPCCGKSAMRYIGRSFHARP